MGQEDHAVIGHGPSVERGPYIPEFLVVSEGGTHRVMERFGPSKHSRESLAPRTSSCSPEAYRPGFWPLVFAAGDPELGSPVPRFEWFSVDDELDVREKTAYRVLALAQSMKGDPMGAISLLTAAGAMMRLDVKKIASRMLDESPSGQKPR